MAKNILYIHEYNHYDDGYAQYLHIVLCELIKRGAVEENPHRDKIEKIGRFFIETTCAFDGFDKMQLDLEETISFFLKNFKND